VTVDVCLFACLSQQEKLYNELIEVAQKKQSEIQQIIVSAIASERATVLQLAADFQFDGNAVHMLRFVILMLSAHVEQK